MTETAAARSFIDDIPAAAALEHLSGAQRGISTWLAGDTLDIVVGPGRMISVRSARDDDRPVVAGLHRDGTTYELEPLDEQQVWVNGERVRSRRLDARDLVQFGEDGPLVRYRLFANGSGPRKSVGEIVSDCIDCVRHGRRPLPARLGAAVRDAVADISRRTTLLFRIGVVAAIAALAALSLLQTRSSARIERQLAEETGRLESFARALARTRAESLQPGDLADLQRQLDHGLSSAASRVAALEARTTATAAVIARAARSIAFLQGAYAFREPDSERWLRYVADDRGRILMDARGRPLLGLDAEGPVAERQFTGTAFLVSASGLLLTNRHVALPGKATPTWRRSRPAGSSRRFASSSPTFRESGTPPLTTTSGKARARRGPAGTSRAAGGGAASEGGGAAAGRGGRRRQGAPHPGGMEGGGGGRRAHREREGGRGHRLLARRRPPRREGFVRPLASRGIVGQVSPNTVVYDAETTRGGSGGPVLNMQGQVVAVNTAIIPEFGGSNFGVPAAFARRLLDEGDGGP
ncbi:MAG: trypsin-like peptidase domain-containing protein [Gammaproteobacteria bacterium]|nr:trypsin-like peptidase domain-containing protein [Gammaproteobacteria bacterium]